MSPDELFAEAVRLEEEGESAAALQVWRGLAQLHPDPVSLCRLASLAEELGEIDEAEQALRQAILSDPGFSAAYSGLGSIAIDRGDYVSAEGLLNQALQIEQDESTYSLLGVTLKHLGRIEEARECHLSALRLNPGFDEPYYNLGSLDGSSLSAVH